MPGLAREVGDLVHDREGLSYSHPSGNRGVRVKRKVVSGGGGEGGKEEDQAGLDRDRNGAVWAWAFREWWER